VPRDCFINIWHGWASIAPVSSMEEPVSSWSKLFEEFDFVLSPAPVIIEEVPDTHQSDRIIDSPRSARSPVQNGNETGIKYLLIHR
jgi:hypothetical protein